MKHQSIAALVLLACSAQAAAVSPLWMRDAAISPDGSRIAFTYKGDIYTVPTEGGRAVRLTSQPGRESAPCWSPDSRYIAYADNRTGNNDVYIIDANGGTPRRLTSNSAGELPSAFSPDGKNVFYSASIQDPAQSALFPSARMSELYSVAVDGNSSPVQVLATPAELISFIPGGNGSFVYQDNKGMENEWRKHHTSSVTRDIWLYDATKGLHTNLTAHAGEDRDPMVSKDGSSLIFLSERDGGSMNVYRAPMAPGATPTALTAHTDHPVRFLSQADNGTIAYTYDGEIYTLAPGQTIPGKVAIDVVVDSANEPLTLTAGSRKSESAVSPDGKEIAVVSRGDIFVTSVEYLTTKQITSDPAEEMHVSWHPNNRSIVYTSERDGHWNIYKATIARKEDPNFSNATLINETALFDGKDGVERSRPQYSPDGEMLAWIENRERLMVKNMNTGQIRQLTDGSQASDRSGEISYAWSPDSRFIALEIVGRKHSPYYDIAVVNVETAEMTPITDTGYFDMSPRWSHDGNAIIFRSDRLGMRNHASWGSLEDVFMVFMNRDAYDRYRLSEEDYALLKEVEKQQKKAEEAKKAKSDKKDKKGKKKKEEKDDSEEKPEDFIEFDKEGIMDRIVRLTPSSSDLSDAILTDDGETLYYLSSFEKGYDLWKKNLRKGDVSLVKKLDLRSAAFDVDAKGKNIFIVNSKSLQKLDPKNDKITSVSMSGKQRIDQQAEREAMFNAVVTHEREMFYDTAMHGVDWTALTDHYRRFLPHINNSYDFSEMLSELLGELNVSHTGSGYHAGGTDALDTTASLGLLYDMSYSGPGKKVDEIVVGGPFDRASTALNVGSVIRSIDGVAIDAATDLSELLNGHTKKKTLVAFTDASGKAHEEVVLPISSGAMSDLLYHRWVRARQADVDRLSGGRLGYVHIRQMADPAFRNVYADVLGKYNDREGIVIDVRWNGGGRMHEDIEVLFSGKKYLTQVVRGKETCDMPSRRWNKPSIMLVCEACYSNAHGTPWVYSERGIGKTVGMPVPGTMTSVNWRYLQNPDIYFGIPVVGYRTADGGYLENRQLEPDITVANDPAAIVKGEDTQLRTAVEALLREIDQKK